MFTVGDNTFKKKLEADASFSQTAKATKKFVSTVYGQGELRRPPETFAQTLVLDIRPLAKSS
jgi:hypothetical protein